jgi:hypothetical protein
MKIAVLLLAHESPAALAAHLASPFWRHPDVKVYLHWDGRHDAAQLATLKAALPGDVSCQVLEDRVVVKWGEHSIVEATRRLMAAALADAAFGAERLLLASASCEPIRPVATLQRFLAARPGIEFIQAHDIALGRWVDDGLEEERFRWFFPFNFATQRGLFEFATRWQRRLRVRRRVPGGLRIHFGSQWFCLTRETAAEVTALLARPDLERFFRRSWIPDEFAIQSLVAHVRTPDRIAGHGLTYYEFDRRGRPLVLDNGHLGHVLAQPFFLARKLAPEAAALRAALHAECARPDDGDDPAWFARAGQPTADFRRFLARAETDPAARSSIGSFTPEAGGAMATNRRPYYVLHGTARGYLLALLRRARRDGPLPLFDFPFERTGMRLAAERHAWYGLRPEDRWRAKYDPRAFLRELVQVDPDPGRPTAFAIDAGVDNAVSEFVARDPRAVIVDCDPPGLDRRRRAAAALCQVVARHDAWILEPTMKALRDGTPLPQDRWRDPATRVAGGARYVALGDLLLDAGDATAAALAEAARDVPAADWYPDREAAELLVAGAIAPKPGKRARGRRRSNG